MESITLISPAKINLFLKVLKKREDGFHGIVSLMQALNLFDRLSFTPSKKDEIILNRESRVEVDEDFYSLEKNLAARAMRVFREKCGVKGFFSIEFQKNIPLQGGMGGGSSNGASTLWAMNQLFKTGLSDLELMEMGAGLGSDVPFFFSSGTALIEGRGEKVTDLKPLHLESIQLLMPLHARVSTQAAFEGLSQSERPSWDEQALIKSCYLGEFSGLRNDFEPGIYEASKALSKARQALQAMAKAPIYLTGTGSTFFTFEPLLSKPSKFITFTADSLNRSENEWYGT